ncbi:unnamed protein product [Wuchereria bancrofti]|uniref:Fucosyltransferase N-terminal domain-containing protein n=2 Tax=Wuchereria bancrofti TaxID=6293 RepID=A0A3P7GGQ1_WUCBA|nr:unnamed protein product [Wuchereria bancrofti]
MITQLLRVSTVLFHIQDLKKLSKLRNPKQLFVFVLHESPLYTFNHLEFVPNNYFNITMTYRHDSDIYLPYDMMKKITNLTQRKQVCDWNEMMKIASGKVRPVLQLVSNCQTKSKRELYVEQLRT